MSGPSASATAKTTWRARWIPLAPCRSSPRPEGSSGSVGGLVRHGLFHAIVVYGELDLEDVVRFDSQRQATLMVGALQVRHGDEAAPRDVELDTWPRHRLEPRSELRDPARAALARVGLAGRGDVLVSNLSHGEHRQLEIAMALATSPRMLLLDEPMAGMGPDESARMVKTLRELKRELTILLIEHDMEAVFALADRITVLVYGRIIASGSPEAIRANAEVRQAYLGEQEQAHA